MWKFTKLEIFYKYISEKFSFSFKAVFDNKLSLFYIRKESDNFRRAGTRKLRLTMKVHLPLVAFYRGLTSLTATDKPASAGQAFTFSAAQLSHLRLLILSNCPWFITKRSLNIWGCIFLFCFSQPRIKCMLLSSYGPKLFPVQLHTPTSASSVLF